MSTSTPTVIKRATPVAIPGTGVKVHAPGTVANLVCGFDILGLCLRAPNDLMEVQLLDRPEVIIHSADGFPLPTDPA
ncbi:MAG: hypothetical protein ACOYKE_13230, partial [Ferruginibacter sp.]